MKKFVKVLKAIGNEIVFLLTGKSNECVKDGTHDFSGQGRNEYGK